MRVSTDVRGTEKADDGVVIGNDPTLKWIEQIALSKEKTDVIGTLDLRFTEGSGVDRDLRSIWSRS